MCLSCLLGHGQYLQAKGSVGNISSDSGAACSHSAVASPRWPRHTALRGQQDPAKYAWSGTCGQRAGAASVLTGQGKAADAGSGADVAQERSSRWCQDLLIALGLGTAFSHSPGIALAVRKGPFLPLILWQFLSRGQSLARLQDLVFSKRLLGCAQFSSWAAL